MAVMRRLGCLLVGITALAVFAGCAGRTTGASQITEQPNGSYSAKLNAVGFCEKGSSSTPCTAYMRWREVGTDAWTNGPSIKVDRKVSDRPWSQTARGLAPKAEYEYQGCGKEFSDEQVMCVGPDATPGTTQEFVAIGSSTGGRETINHVGRNELPAKGGQGTPARGRQGTAPAAGTKTTASEPRPAGNASNATHSGGDGGTSPLVPIVIAVGAVVLLLGGAWWARRGPVPITTPPPAAAAPARTEALEAEARPGPGEIEAEPATLVADETAAPAPSDESVAAEATLAAGGAAHAGVAAVEERPPEAGDRVRVEQEWITAEAERRVGEVESQARAAQERIQVARSAASDRTGEADDPGDRAAEERYRIEVGPQEPERDVLLEVRRRTERQLEERRPREEKLPQELERAAARLEEVEALAADAEARASRAERLAMLKAEQIESARRLRQTHDRIAEAERRASEAEARAREAIERASGPVPPIDA